MICPFGMNLSRYLQQTRLFPSSAVCDSCESVFGSERSSDGDGEVRTLDPLLARQVLSQLSYIPTVPEFDPITACAQPFGKKIPQTRVGFPPPAMRLKEIWQPPTLPGRLQPSTIGRMGLNHRVRDGNGCYPHAHYHQKTLDCFDNPTVKRPLLFLLERR